MEDRCTCTKEAPFPTRPAGPTRRVLQQNFGWWRNSLSPSFNLPLNQNPSLCAPSSVNQWWRQSPFRRGKLPLITPTTSSTPCILPSSVGPLSQPRISIFSLRFALHQHKLRSSNSGSSEEPAFTNCVSPQPTCFLSRSTTTRRYRGRGRRERCGYRGGCGSGQELGEGTGVACGGVAGEREVGLGGACGEGVG